MIVLFLVAMFGMLFISGCKTQKSLCIKEYVNIVIKTNVNTILFLFITMFWYVIFFRYVKLYAMTKIIYITTTIRKTFIWHFIFFPSSWQFANLQSFSKVLYFSINYSKLLFSNSFFNALFISSFILLFLSE